MINLFYAHPLIQVSGALAGLYALYQGWLRFQDRRTGRTATFAWKKHAAAGRLSIGLWLLGIVGVTLLFTVRYGFELDRKPHVVNGFLVVPVALYVLYTGQRLNRYNGPPGARAVLAAKHGVASVLLMLMALFQALSGAAMMFF